MLEITVLVGSLALADAVNPVTIALALYLASDERPHARVAGFTAGVLGGPRDRRRRPAGPSLGAGHGRHRDRAGPADRVSVLRVLVGRARLALDRFAPATVAALTAVMGGGLIVRGADGLLG